MIENPSCPVCGQSAWEVIDSRTYRLSDIASLSDYERDRYRVLFEIWFPNKNEIKLTSKLCQDCGFITYTPRPSADDIGSKYRFLTRLSNSNQPSSPSTCDLKRARILFRLLKRYLPSNRPAQVLDFGGADGRLLKDFVDAKCACHLIDYSDNVQLGVNRLGTTENDLPSKVRFDLIICSHVIEHVAEPVEVLTKLTSHLAPNGVIYVELPMEIWGAAPLQKEPVTHVNFFTIASTRRLLQETGLVPLTCKWSSYPHPSGRTLLCIRAIGKPGVPQWQTNSKAARAEVRRLLDPGLALKLKRRIFMPSTIPAAVFYKAKSWTTMGKARSSADDAVV